MPGDSNILCQSDIQIVCGSCTINNKKQGSLWHWTGFQWKPHKALKPD